MDKYNSAVELLKACSPHVPVLATRLHSIRRAADFFLKHFPGKTLYAVKANDDPIVVEELYNAGIKAFDVASLNEIQQLHPFAEAELFLMNPIKPRFVIAEAYHNYGIRNYALDSIVELEKILHETNQAKDLNLFVRIKCDGVGAHLALDKKFGVYGEEAQELLIAARKKAVKLGVSFHVGSQSMMPEAFSKALESISSLIAKSGVLPDIIDVGGGFPSIYPGMNPPPLQSYMTAIENSFERMNVVETCELLCEPGRALVAEACSLIVRVEHRRENDLYINDGSYGCLHDAAYYGFVYPTRLVRAEGKPYGALQPFALFGPTCDSADYMPGPFYLPSCVKEEDYLEIGQLGAYGQVMQTTFNGFGLYHNVLLENEPILSMYSNSSAENQEAIPLQRQIRKGS